MSKRNNSTYANNVIIDNKIVSVNDLQMKARNSSMKFLVLILGIVLLSSMVIPYLSIAAAATPNSEAFNGTVIPGYSMGGLNLSAYGVDINSWGAVKKPTFVKSNYGIWSKSNIPSNASAIASEFDKSDDQDIANATDKAAGWKELIGTTNHTNNSPDGSTTTTQNEKADSVSPVRTPVDVDYWNGKKINTNNTNDANINVSLYPDFIVISKDSNGKAHIVDSPTNTNEMVINQQDNTDTTAKPIYLPLSKLIESYREDYNKDNKTDDKQDDEQDDKDKNNKNKNKDIMTMNNLFDMIAKNRDPLDKLLQDSDNNDSDNNLLDKTQYFDLNSNQGNNNKDDKNKNSSDAFNPYPYTMVFSTQDSVSNETVVSSIYENCEAYVYFSPTVAYNKYLQLKNEYNSLINAATSSLSSNEQDAVTVVQLGYYSAAMSILESYLEEALPQDMTRGYVGMTETKAVKGKDKDELSQKFGSEESLKKVTYATLMYDVSTSIDNREKYALKYTDAIMDNLSVFGYQRKERTELGVMKGLNKKENFNRETNLTSFSSENKDEKTQTSGVYTPVYYPIQQHKMPDNEKTYRFSILCDIPYSTFINCINVNGVSFSEVELTYSSNFTSSFKSVSDYFSNGKKRSAIDQLVSQYNSDNENTGYMLNKIKISDLTAVKQNTDSDNSSTAQNDSQNSSDGSQENAVQNTSEFNAAERVDSALIGYSADNMTSDNVHDMVDIMRAAPNIKEETFYRFFNPMKSDGGDQDIFITRVTPATTTYFPSPLINGYENAGGAEVDSYYATSGVAFDYFSIPSFAPCFASHTGSDTYYGSLNYELRGFYKKAFIETLSSKTNLPQVAELEDAKNKIDKATKDVSDDSIIEAETMQKNIKSIFVEAKRLAFAEALQKLNKVGKNQHGKLGLGIIKEFYSEIFEQNFNLHFNAEKGMVNKHSYRLDNTDFIPHDIKENCYGNKQSNGSYSKEYDPEGNLNFRWSETIKKPEQISDLGIKGFHWEVPSDESTEHLGGDGGVRIQILADSTKAYADYESKDDSSIRLTDALVTPFQYTLSDNTIINGVAHFNIAGAAEVANKNMNNVSLKMAGYKDNHELFGPVYFSEHNCNPVISYDILEQYKEKFMNKDSEYYWMDYDEILNLNVSSTLGNEIAESEQITGKNEENSLQVVGCTWPKAFFGVLSGSPNTMTAATDETYIKELKKIINNLSKEIFKSIINFNKDMSLIQQSMPSQMQNCLAWADYQNASDSEAQYQSDPTDTIDINTKDKSDDYGSNDTIHGAKDLEKFGFEYDASTGEAKPSASSVGSTNDAIQARMVRGVEGATWTSSGQPACYTMSATIARIEDMSSTGSSYPYRNICSGRLKSGTDQYAILQAHVIDYSSIASGISGDLANRVHSKIISISHQTYASLPNLLDILGNIGAFLAEAAQGFANLTGSMFEDVMWGDGTNSSINVETSDNQSSESSAKTAYITSSSQAKAAYDGKGSLDRKISMFILSSDGLQTIFGLIQSFSLVLVMIGLLYIAFRNFYEYTKIQSASDSKENQSKAAEKKIQSATQLKVVLPRAIVAVFMIGLPVLSEHTTGFQGGNFLLLQMISSVCDQISNVFVSLQGQSLMNLWLNTAGALLEDNPNMGDYIAFALAMFVMGAMFVIGTAAIFITKAMICILYLIGPLMWSLYIWPFSDDNIKALKNNIASKITERIKLFGKDRLGNKAPRGLIETFTETALMVCMWSLIFWAVTIVFVGMSGTISFPSESDGSTSAHAATISYGTSALMATGNYTASSSIAHADGLLNAGILPIPPWGRVLIATMLAVLVFMLMIKMAAGMFKRGMFNTFGAVSAIGGAIAGSMTGFGGNLASLAGKAKKIAPLVNASSKAIGAAQKISSKIPQSVKNGVHAGVNATRKVGGTLSKTAPKLAKAASTAGKIANGDMTANDAFNNMLNRGVRALNDRRAGKNKLALDRIGAAKNELEALKALSPDEAKRRFNSLPPALQKACAHNAPNLFKELSDGTIELNDGIGQKNYNDAINNLDKKYSFMEKQLSKYNRASDKADSGVKDNLRSQYELGDPEHIREVIFDDDGKYDDRTKRNMLRNMNKFSRDMYGSNAPQFDFDRIGDRNYLKQVFQDVLESNANNRMNDVKQQLEQSEQEMRLSSARQTGNYLPTQAATNIINDNVDSMTHALMSGNGLSDNVIAIRKQTDQMKHAIAEQIQYRGGSTDEINRNIAAALTKAASDASANGHLAPMGDMFKLTSDMLAGNGGSTDDALALQRNIGVVQAFTDGNCDLSLVRQASMWMDPSKNRELKNIGSNISNLNKDQKEVFYRLSDQKAAIEASNGYSIPQSTYDTVLNNNPQLRAFVDNNASAKSLLASNASFNDIASSISSDTWSDEETAMLLWAAQEATEYTQQHDQNYMTTISDVCKHTSRQNALDLIRNSGSDENIEEYRQLYNANNNAILQDLHNDAEEKEALAAKAAEQTHNDINQAKVAFNELVAAKQQLASASTETELAVAKTEVARAQSKYEALKKNAQASSKSAASKRLSASAASGKESSARTSFSSSRFNGGSGGL